MHVVAIGLVLLGLWRWTCSRWVYVGWRPPATERREFRRWLAAKQARGDSSDQDTNTVPTANGTGLHRRRRQQGQTMDSDDDSDLVLVPTGIDTDELLPCDRTIWCCCVWPLCWRGKFSPGFFGTVASLWCRIARLFVCAFGLLMLVAGIGAIAVLVAGTGEYHGAGASNRTLVQIWEDNVARIQAERLRHGQL